MTLIMSIAVSCCMAAGPEPTEPLMRQARQGWSRWESACAGLEWAGVVTMDSSSRRGRGEAPETAKIRVLLKDRSLVYQSQAQGKTIVAATNPDYYFQLVSDPKGGYILNESGPSAGGGFDRGSLSSLKYGEQPFKIGGIPPFRELVSEPGFRLIGITPVVRDDRRLMKLAFNYKPTDPRSTAVRGGWIVFSPADHWAQVESELETDWGKVLTAARYGDRKQPKDLPPMRSASITIQGKDGTKLRTQVCEFDRWSFRDLEDGEFRLKAFGLPELALP